MARICAFVLLSLFVNAMVIEGLHFHHDLDQSAHRYTNVEKGQIISKVDSAANSCKLCEVIKHQSHFYQLPSTFTAVVFLEILKENTRVYVPQHPVGYVLSATNKGPPAISA